MNLWIKYGPLFYINSTRINGPVQVYKRGASKFSCKEELLNILYYIWDLIMSGFFVLMFLVINGNISILTAIQYFLLYIYLYVIFLVFYEIGYIYNDVFSIKKEKKPTNYIGDSIDLKFRKTNIVYRIVLGCLMMLPIYLFSSRLCLFFLVISLIMGVTYIIHNYIRNYNINIFTWTILRICKIMLFIIIILNIGINDTFLVHKIIEAYIIFNTFDFFSAFIFEYNRRFGGTISNEICSYTCIILLFLIVFFGVVLKNSYFLIVSLSICPKVIKNAFIVFKRYGIKSNR